MAEAPATPVLTIRLGWLKPEFAGPVLAVLFNLVVLGEQLKSVEPLNDTSVHLAVVRWARRLMDAGQVPVDAWFPQLQFGVAISRHYQALPDLLTAFLSWPLGVDTTFHLLEYLLLATWPVSVYIGVRLLGWDPLVACGAALVSPLVHSVTGYGFEHASYTWQGSGLYTQLWGMWLLPVVYGLTWQAIDGGRRMALAALALALLLMCHFLTAYQAMATAAVFVIVNPRLLPVRFLRFAVVGGVAALAASVVLVPILDGGTYNASSMFLRGTFWDDSYGASKVIGWLAGGELLDEGRFPVLTVLGGIGLLVAGSRARTDMKSRAILGALAVSLVLFSGRPTFRVLIDLLPANGDLLLHRFVAGVHLAWIVLAGVALAWLAERVKEMVGSRLRNQLTAVATLLLALAVLAPAALFVGQDDLRYGPQYDYQTRVQQAQGVDFRTLVAQAQALGGGRLYAGNPADFGDAFKLGFVPANVQLLNLDAPALGFGLRVPALAMDAEALFNSSVVAQYDLFNIRYVIAPAATRMPPAARLIGRRGGMLLWQFPTSGYLELGDTAPPPVIANRFTLGAVDRQILADQDYASGVYHQVAFAGSGAPGATLTAGNLPTSPPGAVLVQASDPERGVYGGQVHVDRSSVLVLKATFDPGWQALVDGRPVPTTMVAPGFPAIRLEPGSHQVTFRYSGETYWPLLLLLGVAAIAALWRLEGRIKRVFVTPVKSEPAPAPVLADPPAPRRRSPRAVPPR